MTSYTGSSLIQVGSSAGCYFASGFDSSFDSLTINVYEGITFTIGSASVPSLFTKNVTINLRAGAVLTYIGTVVFTGSLQYTTTATSTVNYGFFTGSGSSRVNFPTNFTCFNGNRTLTSSVSGITYNTLQRYTVGSTTQVGSSVSVGQCVDSNGDAALIYTYVGGSNSIKFLEGADSGLSEVRYIIYSGLISISDSIFAKPLIVTEYSNTTLNLFGTIVCPYTLYIKRNTIAMGQPTGSAIVNFGTTNNALLLTCSNTDSSDISPLYIPDASIAPKAQHVDTRIRINVDDHTKGITTGCAFTRFTGNLNVNSFIFVFDQDAVENFSPGLDLSKLLLGSNTLSYDLIFNGSGQIIAEYTQVKYSSPAQYVNWTVNSNLHINFRNNVGSNGIPTNTSFVVTVASTEGMLSMSNLEIVGSDNQPVVYILNGILNLDTTVRLFQSTNSPVGYVFVADDAQMLGSPTIPWSSDNTTYLLDTEASPFNIHGTIDPNNYCLFTLDLISPVYDFGDTFKNGGYVARFAVSNLGPSSVSREMSGNITITGAFEKGVTIYDVDSAVAVEFSGCISSSSENGNYAINTTPQYVTSQDEDTGNQIITLVPCAITLTNALTVKCHDGSNFIHPELNITNSAVLNLYHGTYTFNLDTENVATFQQGPINLVSNYNDDPCKEYHITATESIYLSSQVAYALISNSTFFSTVHFITQDSKLIGVKDTIFTDETDQQDGAMVAIEAYAGVELAQSGCEWESGVQWLIHQSGNYPHDGYTLNNAHRGKVQLYVKNRCMSNASWYTLQVVLAVVNDPNDCEDYYHLTDISHCHFKLGQSGTGVFNRVKLCASKGIKIRAQECSTIKFFCSDFTGANESAIKVEGECGVHWNVIFSHDNTFNQYDGNKVLNYHDITVDQEICQNPTIYFHAATYDLNCDKYANIFNQCLYLVDDGNNAYTFNASNGNVTFEVPSAEFTDTGSSYAKLTAHLCGATYNLTSATTTLNCPHPCIQLLGSGSAILTSVTFEGNARAILGVGNCENVANISTFLITPTINGTYRYGIVAYNVACIDSGNASLINTSGIPVYWPNLANTTSTTPYTSSLGLIAYSYNEETYEIVKDNCGKYKHDDNQITSLDFTVACGNTSMTNLLVGTYALNVTLSSLTTLTGSHLSELYYSYCESYYGSFDGSKTHIVTYTDGARRITDTITFPSCNWKYLGGTVESTIGFKFDNAVDQVFQGTGQAEFKGMKFSIEDTSDRPYITCSTSDTAHPNQIIIDGAQDTVGQVTVTLSKRCCVDMFIHPFIGTDNGTTTIDDVTYIGYASTDQSLTYYGDQYYTYSDYIELTDITKVAKIRHGCLASTIYIGANTESNIFYEHGLGLLNIGISPRAEDSTVNDVHGSNPMYSNVFVVSNNPSVATFPEVSTASGSTFGSSSSTTLTYDGNVGTFTRENCYASSYVSYSVTVFVKMPLNTLSGDHQLKLLGTNSNLSYVFTADTNTSISDDVLTFDGSDSSGDHSFICTVQTNSLYAFEFAQQVNATLTITEQADLNSQVTIDDALKVQHLTIPFTMPPIIMVGIDTSEIHDHNIRLMQHTGSVDATFTANGRFYITLMAVGNVVQTMQYSINKYSACHSAVQVGTYTLMDGDTNVETTGYVSWSGCHRHHIYIDLNLGDHVFDLDYQFVTPDTNGGNVIYGNTTYSIILHDGSVNSSDVSTVANIYLYNNYTLSRDISFHIRENILDSQHNVTTSKCVTTTHVTDGRAVVPCHDEWDYCQADATSFPSSYIYGYSITTNWNFTPYITSTGASADLRVQYAFKNDLLDEDFIEVSGNTFGSLCMYTYDEELTYTTSVRPGQRAILSVPTNYSHLYVFAYFASGEDELCHTDMKHASHDRGCAFKVLHLDYSKVPGDTIRGQYMDIGNWRFESTPDGRLQITNIMSYNDDGSAAQVLGTYYLSVPDSLNPTKTLSASAE